MTDSTDNARVCPACEGYGSVATNRNDMDGFPIEVACPECTDLAPDPLGAVKVKPLVWKNGHAHGIGHHYFTRNGCLYRGEASGETGLHCGPAWEIEKVAQADYETRIRSALEPCDPLADPRVVALVDALKHIDALDPEVKVDEMSALVVRGLINRMGETARAALAALSPTGGNADDDN